MQSVFILHKMVKLIDEYLVRISILLEAFLPCSIILRELHKQRREKMLPPFFLLPYTNLTKLFCFWSLI
jgi:hypothetical protein